MHVKSRNGLLIPFGPSSGAIYPVLVGYQLQFCIRAGSKVTSNKSPTPTLLASLVNIYPAQLDL